MNQHKHNDQLILAQLGHGVPQNPIRIRKPRKGEWVRVVSSESCWRTFCLRDATDGYYLVQPSFADRCDNVSRYALFPTWNKHGEWFLWKIKIECLDNTWVKSALHSAYTATKAWVQLVSNQNDQCYTTKTKPINTFNVNFGCADYQSLILSAFQGRIMGDQNPSPVKPVSNLTNPPSIWVIEFMYDHPPGEKIHPKALFAYHIPSKTDVFLNESDLKQYQSIPFVMEDHSLLVGYDLSKTLGCFLSLGWALPHQVVDLSVEFRCLNSGKDAMKLRSMYEVQDYYGLNFIVTRFIDFELQSIASSKINPEQTQACVKQLLAKRVQSQITLLAYLYPNLNIQQAVFRGEDIKVSAHIEQIGIPINQERYQALQNHWEQIKQRLIKKYDQHDVFCDGKLNKERFQIYLKQHHIDWEYDSSNIIVNTDIFKRKALIYPKIQPIYDLYNILIRTRDFNLPIGSDGRNRFVLRPFTSKTSRNQPRKDWIYGLPSWVRYLIQPKTGVGLAYIDYCQQEFAIGAALSGDERMMAAYHSGDPYLAFAKQIEMVPPHATKVSHTRERDIAKQCILGIQYGMGAKSLSESIGQSEDAARELIQKYYTTYSTFRDWISDFIKTAQQQGYAESVNHWRLNVHSQTKKRTLANFPMQANGAEILRLACRKAIKQNIQICSPVHDALLIEAPLDDLELIIARTQQVMAEASKEILNGFEIRTDVMVVHHPHHYESQKGARMWKLIQTALNESCDENERNHDALNLMSYLENI